jgi:carbonic anhydrase
MFDDVKAANDQYASTFQLADLTPGAARGLAVVTCIDSRIEPLPMLGLVPGDAKILRNAGGRVSTDVLRSLAIATAMLGVTRIAVMHHTNCAMTRDELEIAGGVADASGHATDGWHFLSLADPETALAEDVAAVRDCPIIADSVAVEGWRYDVYTGLIETVIGPR